MLGGYTTHQATQRKSSVQCQVAASVGSLVEFLSWHAFHGLPKNIYASPRQPPCNSAQSGVAAIRATKSNSSPPAGCRDNARKQADQASRTGAKHPVLFSVHATETEHTAISTNTPAPSTAAKSTVEPTLAPRDSTEFCSRSSRGRELLKA